MAEDLKLRVNERMVTVAADRDTPLLCVLTNELGLQGPRFGCGLAQCSGAVRRTGIGQRGRDPAACLNWLERPDHGDIFRTDRLSVWQRHRDAAGGGCIDSRPHRNFFARPRPSGPGDSSSATVR